MEKEEGKLIYFLDSITSSQTRIAIWDIPISYLGGGKSKVADYFVVCLVNVCRNWINEHVITDIHISKVTFLQEKLNRNRFFVMGKISLGNVNIFFWELILRVAKLLAFFYHMPDYRI